MRLNTLKSFLIPYYCSVSTPNSILISFSPQIILFYFVGRFDIFWIFEWWNLVGMRYTLSMMIPYVQGTYPKNPCLIWFSFVQAMPNLTFWSSYGHECQMQEFDAHSTFKFYLILLLFSNLKIWNNLSYKIKKRL